MAEGFECGVCKMDLHKCECECSSKFISGSDDLTKFLEFCLTRAEKEVIISSPWITGKAVQTIARHLQKMSEISVHVYTDCVGNLDANDDVDPLDWTVSFDIYKEEFVKGVEMLRNHKVAVHELQGVHNKSLVVDDKIFVDGSFNWLSARRARADKFTLHDSVIAISGKRAARHRTEFLHAQFTMPYRGPLALDSRDVEDQTRNFILYDRPPLREIMYKPEPIATTPIVLPLSHKLYFAVLLESANRVARRGVDAGLLALNSGGISLAKTRENAFQAEVTTKVEELVDNPHEFAVFAVNRERLTQDLALVGTFSRYNLYSNSSTTLWTSDTIPPEALERDETIFQHTP